MWSALHGRTRKLSNPRVTSLPLRIVRGGKQNEVGHMNKFGIASMVGVWFAVGLLWMNQREYEKQVVRTEPVRVKVQQPMSHCPDLKSAMGSMLGAKEILKQLIADGDVMSSRFDDAKSTYGRFYDAAKAEAAKCYSTSEDRILFRGTDGLTGKKTFY